MSYERTILDKMPVFVVCGGGIRQYNGTYYTSLSTLPVAFGVQVLNQIKALKDEAEYLRAVIKEKQQ